MDERADDDLIQLLRERDGSRTIVDLRRNISLVVVNIAWGYDLGEPYAHVSTNISPIVEGEDFDFFHTYEVTRIRDEFSRSEIFDGSNAASASYWLRSLGYELVFTKEGDIWWTALRAAGEPGVLHAKYGVGETNDAAVLRAAKRWQVEQIGRP